ncbi:MAG TPA: hypothetical protein ENN87_05575 [Phycisphaerales bacterium]|nr:hypothetical protein [Phycisphaerales bacterium]
MEGGNTGRQIDGDILQSKADILRARQEGLGANSSSTGSGEASGNEAKPRPAALRPLDQVRVGEATAARPVQPDVVKPLPAALRPLGTPVGGAAESPFDQDETEEGDLARRIQSALEHVARQESFEPEQSAAPQSEGPIPQLDLAEQILAEQRRAVAQRRQRPEKAAVAGADGRGIHRVVQAIRGETRREESIWAPARSAVAGVSCAEVGTSEIARIVARDIARLYGRR